MTIARSALVAIADTPYYHCIGRCVRRAYLCGEDRVSGKSFEHRRTWITERLALLTEVFAIDLCAYAIMSNHYHLVVRLAPTRAAGWSTAEVIIRWCRIFNGHALAQRVLAGADLDAAQRAELDVLVARWRERLGNLSWFMRCLNEYIARLGNAEDGCTGHFWEGRFKCQALLDEQALLTAMAYVDLNPARAGLAKSLQTADFTSIQHRLTALSPLLSPDESTAPRPTLLPFADEAPLGTLDVIPFTAPSYFDLIDATSRHIRDERHGFVAAGTPRMLAQLGIAPVAWLDTVTRSSDHFERVLGAPCRRTELARKLGQRWLRGQRAARRYYLRQAE